MAKAIFLKEFNHTPKGVGFSWNVKPSKVAQSFPKHLIDAAIKSGAAILEAEKSPKSQKK